MVVASFLKSEFVENCPRCHSNINKDEEEVKNQEEPGEDSPDIKVHGC